MGDASVTANNAGIINENMEKVSDDIPDKYQYGYQRPNPYGYAKYFDIPESSYVRIVLLNEERFDENDLPGSFNGLIKDTIYTYYHSILGPGSYMFKPWQGDDLDTLSAGIYLISFEALPTKINLLDPFAVLTKYYRIEKKTILVK
ncbi:MAG: hypothetical protein GWO28_18505 [candidate division Zixibacteria bacterium]|nr:hypothetical protein [candidate division Zixibacteria bacterium]